MDQDTDKIAVGAIFPLHFSEECVCEKLEKFQNFKALFHNVCQMN